MDAGHPMHKHFWPDDVAEPFDLDAKHPDWKEGYILGLAGKSTIQATIEAMPENPAEFAKGWGEGNNDYRDQSTHEMVDICPGIPVEPCCPLPSTGPG